MGCNLILEWNWAAGCSMLSLNSSRNVRTHRLGMSRGWAGDGPRIPVSMDWFKGQFAGKPHDLHDKIDGFRLRFSLKPIHWWLGVGKSMEIISKSLYPEFAEWMILYFPNGKCTTWGIYWYRRYMSLLPEVNPSCSWKNCSNLPRNTVQCEAPQL